VVLAVKNGTIPRLAKGCVEGGGAQRRAETIQPAADPRRARQLLRKLAAWAGPRGLKAYAHKRRRHAPTGATPVAADNEPVEFIHWSRRKPMRNARTIAAGLVATAAALTLAGCDVDKTREGDVTVPKYEVEKTQSGNVTLPKYDVTLPDVNVSKKETEITVPKVTTEEKTITVPTVDIKTGQEKAAEKK
jgi:hypothetical protein